MRRGITTRRSNSELEDPRKRNGVSNRRDGMVLWAFCAASVIAELSKNLEDELAEAAAKNKPADQVKLSKLNGLKFILDALEDIFPITESDFTEKFNLKKVRLSEYFFLNLIGSAEKEYPALRSGFFSRVSDTFDLMQLDYWNAYWREKGNSLVTGKGL